jgi:hypothetical protein
MLIHTPNKDIINIDKVAKIKKIDEENTYSILFDADKWIFDTEQERNTKYDYIVDNFTKKI